MLGRLGTLLGNLGAILSPLCQNPEHDPTKTPKNLTFLKFWNNFKGPFKDTFWDQFFNSFRTIFRPLVDPFWGSFWVPDQPWACQNAPPESRQELQSSEKVPFQQP